MESLFDKLKSLGVKIGSDFQPIQPVKKYPVDAVMPGEWLDYSQGQFFLVNDNFPFGHQHGSHKIEKDFSFDTLLDLVKIGSRDINLNQIVFIDTETTSLSSGAGTIIFLIGLGYFTEDGFRINQYFLDNPYEELALLTYVNNEVSKYALVVSYNGSSFDLPILKSRFALHKLKSPFIELDHLDLLHLSRRVWKTRLLNCRLRDIENSVLNFYRHEEEVPGYLVPQIYFDYLHTNDARPLRGVFYHNQMDVLSLALTFSQLSKLVMTPYGMGDNESPDLLSIARLFERNRLWQESAHLYRLSLDNGLEEDLEAVALLRYGNICKRLQHFEEAVEFWSSSFHCGSFEAGVEIAKYYEHQKRDFTSALDWVNRIVQKHDEVISNSSGSYNKSRDELIKRKNRLEGRIKDIKVQLNHK
jgi:hypothetical protein